MKHRLRMHQTFRNILLKHTLLNDLDYYCYTIVFRHRHLEGRTMGDGVDSIDGLSLFEIFLLTPVQGCEMKKLKISTSGLGCMVLLWSHFSRI